MACQRRCKCLEITNRGVDSWRVGQCVYEMDDSIQISDYEDVRMELSALGCNLTSVLMNPRDTTYEFMDDIWEDITSDTSTHSTAVSSTHGLVTSDSLLSLSGHSGGRSSNGNLVGTADEGMSYLNPYYANYEAIHKENNITQDNRNQQNSDSDNHAARCFRDVPHMFFEKDFLIYQARILDGSIHDDNTTNNNQVDNEPSSSSSSVSSNGQIKKLNDYLDLVEYALLQQIWSRSGDIFSALDDIKGQQDQVASAISKLDTLHNHLRTVDEKVASSAVHIPLMNRRRNNQSALLHVLSSMQRVLEGKNNVQVLLEGGDFINALDLLGDCKHLFNTELTSVLCMKGIGEQLDAYDSFLCEVISNRFVSQAIEFEHESDNHDKIESKSTDDLSELERLAGGGDVEVHTNNSELTLGQLMQALHVIGRLTPAFNMYKSRLVEGLKLIVRTCVTEYMVGNDSITGNSTGVEDTPANSEQPFAKRIRAMPMDQFLSCVIICFEQLLQALERAHVVHVYMLKSLDNENKAESSEDSTNTSHNLAATKVSNEEGLHELSKTCLISACDIAQRALSQLLLMRKADASRLSLDNMKLLWETAARFAARVEKMSESSAYIIRQALQQQTVAFLTHIHEHGKLKLASTMDSEKWIQCDVPPEKQEQIDRLASGKAFLMNRSNSNTTLTATGVTISTTDSTDDMIPSTTNSGSITNKSNKAKRSGHDMTPVIVDGVPFKVVWSSLLLMEIIMSYLEIAIGFPSITGEVIIMTKDIIIFFNKQTLALVLGSGAQKSQAQLRSISAKHLTVTAQSIGLILAMLPHIRAAFLTQLPPNRSMQLTELDRVSQDLLDHHSKILTKFVIILGDSIDMSAPKLNGVNWDVSSPGQIDYFEDLSKNITALHRVLLLDSMLPLEQVQDIFSRIFSLLLRKVPSHFEDVIPHTKTGKQRILDEVTHLSSSFSLLKSVDCVNEMTQLEETFRRKYL